MKMFLVSYSLVVAQTFVVSKKVRTRQSFYGHRLQKNRGNIDLVPPIHHLQTGALFSTYFLALHEIRKSELAIGSRFLKRKVSAHMFSDDELNQSIYL